MVMLERQQVKAQGIINEVYDERDDDIVPVFRFDKGVLIVRFDKEAIIYSSCLTNLAKAGFMPSVFLNDGDIILAVYD